METSLVIFVLLGFVSYWVVKIPGTIKGKNPINTISAFFLENMGELFLSTIGVLFLILAGDSLPAEWGRFDSPLTAFIAGGSIPSMFMNFISVVFKK